jgi:hypothetical protein
MGGRVDLSVDLVAGDVEGRALDPLLRDRLLRCHGKRNPQGQRNAWKKVSRPAKESTKSSQPFNMLCTHRSFHKYAAVPETDVV